MRGDDEFDSCEEQAAGPEDLSGVDWSMSSPSDEDMSDKDYQAMATRSDLESVRYRRHLSGYYSDADADEALPDALSSTSSPPSPPRTSRALRSRSTAPSELREVIRIL